jgi:hypothetical protein
MHPTADTLLLKFLQSLWAAGEPGVRLHGFFKPDNGGLRLVTARGSFSFRHSSYGNGPRLGLSLAGRGGRCGLRVRWVAGGGRCLNGAAEQANAPDRRHDECHHEQSGGAAGDWRRYALADIVSYKTLSTSEEPEL